MPTGLQPVPFGHSGTDPEDVEDTHHRGGPRRPPLTSLRAMPSFDVVSQIDLQEVRNAVDQASREVRTRFDFKGTESVIELQEGAIKLESSTEDRLAALEAVDHRQKMQFSWLLQEYRVSVFAQNLGTIVPISEKRLEKAWHALTDNRQG